MSDDDNWLDRYQRNQASLANPLAWWIAAPMVVFGTVGLLWSLPVPQQFHDISPLLNWGSAFLMVAAIYYFIISLSLAIGLLPFLLGLAAFQMWLAGSGYPPFGVSVGLLAAGVAGIVLGRRGRPGAILEDLQLIMIGPAWLLAAVYRRYGIPI